MSSPSVRQACLPGGVGRELAGLIPVGVGGANPLVGLGAGLVDCRISVRLRRGNFPAGLRNRGVAVGFGGGDRAGVAHPARGPPASVSSSCREPLRPSHCQDHH